jgi:hypothetical protein
LFRAVRCRVERVCLFSRVFPRFRGQSSTHVDDTRPRSLRNSVSRLVAARPPLLRPLALGTTWPWSAYFALCPQHPHDPACEGSGKGKTKCSTQRCRGVPSQR